MKSKSSTFLIIAVIILVVLAGVYFFVIRKNDAPEASQPGLVSTTTGTSTGLQQNAAAGGTGSQVVEILRNVSALRLDDSVFQNPAFALLVDTSIVLPPPTTQGRRNPFAPVAIDAGTPDVSTIPTPTATAAGTASSL